MPRILLGSVFLSAYLTWRPAEIMFTYSDGLFIVGASILLFRGQLPTRPFGQLTLLWLLSFSLLVGGLLVSSLVNGDPMRWLIVAGQYCFAWVLLPCFLIGHGHDNSVRLIKSLIAGMFCMQLLAVLVYFFHDGTPQQVQGIFGHDFLAGNRRVSAFVTDGNWNAAAISMALMFVVYCSVKRLVSTVTTIFAAAVLGTGLVLSASFTGFVCSTSALVVFYLIAAVRPRLRTLLLLAAAVLVAVQSGYTLPSAFQTRVATALTDGDLAQAGTYEGRMALIEEAWAIVEDRMLIGLGVDQYRVVSAEEAPVHNIYLLLWAEGGFPALLGWLGMLATIAVAAGLSYRADRVAAGLTASVLWVLIVFSMANPHMYNRMWVVPIILALAVAFDAISGAGRPAMARSAPIAARDG